MREKLYNIIKSKVLENSDRIVGLMEYAYPDNYFHPVFGLTGKVTKKYSNQIKNFKIRSSVGFLYYDIYRQLKGYNYYERAKDLENKFKDNDWRLNILDKFAKKLTSAVLDKINYCWHKTLKYRQKEQLLDWKIQLREFDCLPNRKVIFEISMNNN